MVNENLIKIEASMETRDRRDLGPLLPITYAIGIHDYTSFLPIAISDPVHQLFADMAQYL